jgi:hypothetical protein
MRVGRRWNLARIALDRSRAGRTAKGRSAAIVADEKKCLSRVVRIRTWLAHELSSVLQCGAARLASHKVTLTAIH